MITYLRIKRERIGRCNICLEDSSLSWDHVPPQGSIDLGRVEMESLLGRMTTASQVKGTAISQNGVKYRTICSNCNSKLGARFDPVLNKFSSDVGLFLKSGLEIPRYININSRPTALIRSVIGHLLAASMSPDGGLGSKNIGEFLFDESAQIPPGISVFYWIYPYTTIAVVRDIGMPAVRGRFDKVGLFNILKFFPIAYLVTDIPAYEHLQELTIFRQYPATYEADVSVDLQSAKDPRWPDVIEDGNVIVGGAPLQSSIYARPKH